MVKVTLEKERLQEAIKFVSYSTEKDMGSPVRIDVEADTDLVTLTTSNGVMSSSVTLSTNAPVDSNLSCAMSLDLLSASLRACMGEEVVLTLSKTSVVLEGLRTRVKATARDGKNVNYSGIGDDYEELAVSFGELQTWLGAAGWVLSDGTNVWGGVHLVTKGGKIDIVNGTSCSLMLVNSSQESSLTTTDVSLPPEFVKAVSALPLAKDDVVKLRVSSSGTRISIGIDGLFETASSTTNHPFPDYSKWVSFTQDNDPISVDRSTLQDALNSVSNIASVANGKSFLVDAGCEIRFTEDGAILMKLLGSSNSIETSLMYVGDSVNQTINMNPYTLSQALKQFSGDTVMLGVPKCSAVTSDAPAASVKPMTLSSKDSYGNNMLYMLQQRRGI